MFKKANKTELKTWMMGDLVLFIVLAIASATMVGTFFDDTVEGRVKYLIFGIIFILLAIWCIYLFIKMIQAFKTHDERMSVLEAQMEQERLEQEKLEKERLAQEEEENKRFAEEYQKKVQESMENFKNQKAPENQKKNK